MVRWSAALLLWIAYDAGVRKTSHRPHTIARSKLELQGLTIPLPKHGLAVQTFGMGGYFDLEVIDTDAKTMRVIRGVATVDAVYRAAH